MRRRKLGVAGFLLLAWATTFVGAWNNPPFERPIHTNNELVRWNETCTSEPNCALVFLKENVEDPIELLRLNTDVEPHFAGIVSPILGFQIREDSEVPKYYLQATKPGDFEGSKTTFRQSFSVNDQDYYAAIIEIENVNDNEPVIKEPKDCKVLEGEKGEQKNCTFTVTDEDGSACYIQMSATDDHFSFKLVGEPEKYSKEATYVLYVEEELDFETYRLHSMTINAKDVGQVGPDEYLTPQHVHEVSLAFVVTVIDRPDVEPKWTKMTPSITVVEMTPQTEEFVAIDGDIDLDWKIEYRVESLEPEYEDYFKMDEKLGVLEIKPIDRDTSQKDVYNLRIYAKEVPEYPWEDEVPKEISADIVVMVKDLNNNIPKFEAHFPNIIYVNESAYFSEKLFTVKDPDLAENGTFNIDFETNEYAHNFMIVPTTGYQSSTITVAVIDASKLDYEDEVWKEILLKFVATESADAGHKGFANITIILNDLNDEPPIFKEDQYTPEVFENQDADALIIKVEATDKDEGDVIEYFLRTNSASSILKIDNESGEIRTKSMAFDYERQTELLVQVYAYDTADPPHQGSCEVLIKIKNINDEKPLLELPPETVETEEHSEVGTRVSNVISATDPDLELANLEFYINWTASQAYKSGILVQSPEDYIDVLELEEVQKEGDVWMTYLIIKDQDRFDWEKFESLRVNIVVNDTQTDSNYKNNELNSGFVTVNVLDINDCAPIFTVDSDTEVDVIENNTNIRLVGAVRATDEDSAPYSNIVYSIRPSFPEGLATNQLQLDVNNKTGQLFTTREPFDCEQFQEMEYEYIIYASDGDPDHDASITITVKVEDINDNFPTYYETIPEDVRNPKIYEKQDGPQKIICLNAEDRDRTKPFNVITYFLVEDEMNLLFKMESACLWAIDGKNLDREDNFGEIRSIAVNTRDNFEDGNRYNSNEGDKITINLTLLDINDNAPQFPDLELQAVNEMSTGKEKELFSLQITDPDNGVNGSIVCKEMEVKVEYPVGRPDVNKLFGMKTDKAKKTCIVYTEEVVLWGDYIFHLTVFDEGVPPLNSSASYTQKIENVILRDPVIVKPEPKKIFRLRRNAVSQNNEPLLDIYDVPIEDFEVTDEDDPRTVYGQVKLTLYDSEDLFTVNQVSSTMFRLRKIGTPDSNTRKLEMKLQASDKAESPNFSKEVPISVYFIEMNSVPEFRNGEFVTSFTEEEEGMNERREIEEAYNEEEDLLEEEYRQPVFYFIIDDNEYFELVNKTRILKLKKTLDFEAEQNHTLMVAATHEETKPKDPPPNSILTVIVNVVDINDMPPVFSHKQFHGVFRTSDTVSAAKTLTTVTAEDKDTDDTITYEIIPNTMGSESPSLKPLVNGENFKVDKSSGQVSLNFEPAGKDLSGFIYFQVVAYDSAGDVDGHRDEAQVLLYVVSEKHQVVFNFYNEVDDLLSKEKEICPALTGVLKDYECSVEKIVKASGESASGGPHTDVYTHFIDENAPIETTVVTSQFLEGDTYAQLIRAMSELQLTLLYFSAPTQPEEEGGVTVVVLIAVCSVLGVLVMVFALLFFARTRTLNQRLEKLTMKKFGSQDSGLNRETLAVPGTNRHALEGSNPVWNHEIDPNFDAQSQMSGDSDLIGIEDSPEFGGESALANPAFERDVIREYDSPPPYEGSSMGRASINPLAVHGQASNDPYGFSEPLSGGDMDVPRRFSINPLASGGLDMDFDANEEESNAVEVDNAFFKTFEPTTEL